MTSPEVSTKLGKQMRAYVDEMSDKYCGKDSSRRAIYSPFKALLLFGNSEDFLRNYKKTTFNRGIKIQQIIIAASMIGATAVFPPMIVFSVPVTFAILGAYEIAKRIVNNEDKKCANLMPGAKKTLTDMLDTLRDASEEFSRNPQRNRQQLKEVISGFESFWSYKNGLAPSALTKGEGLTSAGVTTIDPAIQKAINSCYSTATSLLAHNSSSGSKTTTDSQLGKSIRPETLTSNPKPQGPDLGR